MKIALVCAGCLAVVLALAAGRLDSLFSSAEPAGRDGTAGVTTTVAVEAPVPPVAPEPEPEPGSRRTPEGRGGRDGDAGEAGGLSEAAGGLLAAIRKPYAGPEASARVLFRMSLDLLERPPTRAEARSLLPLGHEERWARLRAMAAAPSSPDRDMSSWAFSAFLGRRPRAGECEALEEALDALRRTGKEGDPPAEAGLLLTATEEYRSPEFLRKRSPRQHARSLLVDLLDRPPAPEEEADLEQVLSEYPGGWAAARVILHSPEAAGAVPRLPPDDAARAPAARAFLEEEFLRFLGRRPREEEVRELEREVLETPDGPRWVRLGLVSTPGYRSY